MAIGDLHGDMDAARAALRLAGAVDEEGHWAGGKLTVVQTGDILDRGDDEEAILELFLRLQEGARAAGGEIYLLNGAIQEWLRGEAPRPEWVRGDRSPVWTRLYSAEPTVAACDTLATMLQRLGAERMVVGHTVQRTGITVYCGGRVWCIDVGLAAHYGGCPEVLEIQGERVRSLR